MAHSRQELIEMALELCEGRAKKLTLEKWFDLAAKKLINRKDWWWRKKIFTLPTVGGTANYDLDNAGAGVAPDFSRMINLVRSEAGNNSKVEFRGHDRKRVLEIFANTTQGEPSEWIILPGTSKTIRLSLIPNAVYTLYGYYWASYNPKVAQSSETIPLIPEQYDYVALWCFLRTVFFYLFGQGDPRYVAANAEYEAGIKDLELLESPAIDEVPEMRSTDPRDSIRATR